MITVLAVALTVLSAVGVLFSNFSVLVSVARLRQDFNHNTGEIVEAHNIVGGRVRELADAVLNGIDFLASHHASGQEKR